LHLDGANILIFDRGGSLLQGLKAHAVGGEAIL